MENYDRCDASDSMQRRHLLERRDDNMDKKLILICPQAAQGKSTLAGSYAKKSEVPTAWLNLIVEKRIEIHSH
jgi:ATP/maltotriose-dependent transcriptional regulator MalT